MRRKKGKIVLRGRECDVLSESRKRKKKNIFADAGLLGNNSPDRAKISTAGRGKRPLLSPPDRRKEIYREKKTNSQGKEDSVGEKRGGKGTHAGVSPRVNSFKT